MTTYNEERFELQQALKEFAASPRFNLLKSLQVGPLLGDDASTLGTIATITFEELVASLDNQLSDLHKLSDAQKRLLVAVLRALSEGEVSEQSEPNFEVSDESHGDPDEETVQTTFTSVQCELELRHQIDHLKNHPELSRIGERTVGSFWRDEAPRAPFEEALTINQLLSLDIGVLAKKRSMTSVRMRALALALERALEVLTSGEEPPRFDPQVSREAPHIERVSQRQLVRHRWQAHLGEYSPGDMALLESVMFAGSDDPADTDTIFGALHHFCSAFTASEFLAIVKGGALSSSTQRKLSAWARSGALREVAPLFQMTLQGPGAHIHRFARILQAGDVVASVYGIVATLIVRGLGATPVSFNDKVCPDVWTRNPSLVSLVTKEARALTKTSFSQALTLVCPDMDPFLHAWLQGFISAHKKGKKRPKKR